MTATICENGKNSPSAKVVILDAIATIKQELRKTSPPPLLSDPERNQAALVSNTCMPFIDRTFNKYLFQCSQIIPCHKSPEEALRHYALIKDLKEIAASMRQLMELVDDLDAVYKNDVYYYFLKFYILVRENLESPGVGYVYNDLRKLFEGIDEGDIQETRTILSML